MLKADLHVHTEFSMDCSLTLDSLVESCLKKGINCVAISDHATIAGALKLAKTAPFTVIVAEEVLTPVGEIMGMFLTEEIPSPTSPEDAIARIKAQGGLVCIPHPFDQARSSAMKLEALKKFVSQIDIIEGFNSRNLIAGTSVQARAFAASHGLPISAGSDAHTASGIGNAYIEMPEFKNKDEFLKALRAGRIVGHKSSPFVFVENTWAKLTCRKKRD